MRVCVGGGGGGGGGRLLDMGVYEREASNTNFTHQRGRLLDH